MPRSLAPGPHLLPGSHSLTQVLPAECQAHAYPRAFALAVLFARNALPLDIFITCALNSLLKNHLPNGPSLITLAENI